MGLSALVGSAAVGLRTVKKAVTPEMPRSPAAPPVPTANDPATRASYEDAQRRRASAGTSADARGGTMLTGPLGLTDEPETRRKTILGS